MHCDNVFCKFCLSFGEFSIQNILAYLCVICGTSLRHYIGPHKYVICPISGQIARKMACICGSSLKKDIMSHNALNSKGIQVYKFSKV